METITQTQTKRWAEERAAHYWVKGTAKFPFALGHNTIMPTIKWNDSSRAKVAGLATHNLNTGLRELKFSSRFLSQPDFENTIIHEVAHLIASFHYNKNCKHDARWKTVMLGMGVLPHRCHTYLCEKTQYHCTCGNIEERLTMEVTKKLKMGITTTKCHKCSAVIMLQENSPNEKDIS